MSSPLYKRIYETAVEHIRGFDEFPDDILDEPRFRACHTADCVFSWGHNLQRSGGPFTSKDLDIDGFIAQLRKMMPGLASRRQEITDVYVDELRRSAIVRVSLFQLAKNSTTEIEQDMVWFLNLTEDGSKIKYASEFLDGAAMQAFQKTLGVHKAP